LNNSDVQVITTWLFQTGHPEDPQDTRILINIRLAGAILVMLPTFFFYFLLRSRIMKAISKQGNSIKG
jgi:multiple sugar transport system permease protein